MAGCITLNGIVRGPLLSGTLGYWIARRYTRRGLASAAVAHVVRTAFDELGPHRVEAGTLVDDTASQRVLARNGFERFGLPPRYLRIAGRWPDHVLFQRGPTRGWRRGRGLIGAAQQRTSAASGCGAAAGTSAAGSGAAGGPISTGTTVE